MLLITIQILNCIFWVTSSCQTRYIFEIPPHPFFFFFFLAIFIFFFLSTLDANINTFQMWYFCTKNLRPDQTATFSNCSSNYFLVLIGGGLILTNLENFNRFYSKTFFWFRFFFFFFFFIFQSSLRKAETYYKKSQFKSRNTT